MFDIVRAYYIIKAEKLKHSGRVLDRSGRHSGRRRLYVIRHNIMDIFYFIFGYAELVENNIKLRPFDYNTQYNKNSVNTTKKQYPE